MTPGLYRPESIPVHDTAPSEVEPPESTLNPCGCDPAIGQECAICCPHPSRAGTIAAIDALEVEDLPVRDHEQLILSIEAPKEIRLSVQDHPPFTNREQAGTVNILHDALEITGGDRQAAYGSPRDNWTRTARIAQAITGLDCLTPEVCVKVAMAMKQARLIQTPNHRDSMVDLAGYSWVLSEVVNG